MPVPIYHAVGVVFGAISGIATSLVLLFLDIAFWKQLIIAVVSAGIGAIGAVIAAMIAVHAVRRGTADVKEEIGVQAEKDRNGHASK